MARLGPRLMSWMAAPPLAVMVLLLAPGETRACSGPPLTFDGAKPVHSANSSREAWAQHSDIRSSRRSGF